jgi:hypothetical protein
VSRFPMGKNEFFSPACRSSIVPSNKAILFFYRSM